MECWDIPLVTDSETVVETEVGRLTGRVMDRGTVLTTESVACVGAIEDASLGPVEETRTPDEMMECWETWSVEESEAPNDSSPGETEEGVEVATLESCVVTLSSIKLLVWNEEWGMIFVGKELDIESLAFWRLTELSTKELITGCVDVSKSNEVAMFVRVSAADVFNDQDDGAIDDSTNRLDDTIELWRSSEVTIVVSVEIITSVEVTFCDNDEVVNGSDEEVSGSDEEVSGSDDEVSDVCGNDKDVLCCSEEVNDSDEETCGSDEEVNGWYEEVNGWVAEAVGSDENLLMTESSVAVDCILMVIVFVWSNTELDVSDWLAESVISVVEIVNEGTTVTSELSGWCEVMLSLWMELSGAVDDCRVVLCTGTTFDDDPANTENSDDDETNDVSVEFSDT